MEGTFKYTVTKLHAHSTGTNQKGIKYYFTHKLTPILNIQEDPTGTPGIGPKWFEGTTEHTLVLPTQAMP